MRHDAAINPAPVGTRVICLGPEDDAVGPYVNSRVLPRRYWTPGDDGKLEQLLEVAARVHTLVGEGEQVAVALGMRVHALGRILPGGRSLFLGARYGGSEIVDTLLQRVENIGLGPSFRSRVC